MGGAAWSHARLQVLASLSHASAYLGGLSCAPRCVFYPDVQQACFEARVSISSSPLAHTRFCAVFEAYYSLLNPPFGTTAKAHRLRLQGTLPMKSSLAEIFKTKGGIVEYARSRNTLYSVRGHILPHLPAIWTRCNLLSVRAKFQLANKRGDFI